MCEQADTECFPYSRDLNLHTQFLHDHAEVEHEAIRAELVVVDLRGEQ